MNLSNFNWPLGDFHVSLFIKKKEASIVTNMPRFG
jgi:hypothetical protein